jgi:hypothetical protein
MALKRRSVGSFCKPKDATKPPYIKLNEDLVLAKGDFLRVESKKFQLESLEAAISNGKLGGDMAESIRARIEKMPDWVIGEVVQLKAVDGN